MSNPYQSPLPTEIDDLISAMALRIMTNLYFGKDVVLSINGEIVGFMLSADWLNKTGRFLPKDAPNTP